MKEEYYRIALDGYEHGVVVRALNDSKTELTHEGKLTDAASDLVIKVGHTPRKKFRVIERKESSGCESK